MILLMICDLGIALIVVGITYKVTKLIIRHERDV